MLNQIFTKINSIFTRGKITTISESERLQIQQNELHKGQIRSDIYAPQQYGVQTYPHVGADTLCLFKGGSVENGAVIMSYDPRYKPTDIKEGDTFLYTSRNTNNTDSKATGTVIFEGSVEDVIIPVGTLLMDPVDGARYITIEQGQILGGRAWVRTEAVIGGIEGNRVQGTVLDWDTVLPQIPIPTITATVVNNMSVTHQKIWIKQENGRILIETTDADVQVIADNAEVNTIGDATVTAGGDASVRAVNNVNVKANHVVVDTNTADLNITVSATVDCPLTTWTGNIVHLGNFTQTGINTLIGNSFQTGDYALTGTGTATVDFVSAGKSGAGHTHTGNLGAPTSSPI